MKWDEETKTWAVLAILGGSFFGLVMTGMGLWVIEQIVPGKLLLYIGTNNVPLFLQRESNDTYLITATGTHLHFQTSFPLPTVLPGICYEILLKENIQTRSAQLLVQPVDASYCD